MNKIRFKIITTNSDELLVYRSLYDEEIGDKTC